MTAGFNIKKWHFDQMKVLKQQQRNTNKALSGAAAYVWRAAVNSIKKAPNLPMGEMTANQRKRYEAKVLHARLLGKPKPKAPKKAAKPGQIPFSPTGILKKTIRFAVDRNKGSATIGAIPFNTNTASQLEHGGRANIPIRSGKLVSMEFQGNPFMKPALEKTESKIPSFFKNIL